MKRRWAGKKTDQHNQDNRMVITRNRKTKQRKKKLKQSSKIKYQKKQNHETLSRWREYRPNQEPLEEYDEIKHQCNNKYLAPPPPNQTITNVQRITAIEKM